jgi:hypothetical protein
MMHLHKVCVIHRILKARGVRIRKEKVSFGSGAGRIKEGFDFTFYIARNETQK